MRQIIEQNHQTSLCTAPDRGSYYGFREERIEIGSCHLHAGQNMLKLQFGSGKNPFEAIMYDYLKLDSR